MKSFETVEEVVEYLEDEYDIRVLAIRDYGSRAWNLDSESSDMDAGMLFMQDKEKYIKLGTYRQNIDRTFELDGEEFEIIGWNIDRFMELLNKSNPSMIEWLNSDINYYSDELFFGGVGEVDDILTQIREHANENFKPIALWGHYRQMAKANYKKYIENRNDLSIKRHLYILRGLLYARYVLETHKRPNLNFPVFLEEELDEIDIPVFVEQAVSQFAARKKRGEGSHKIQADELWQWMDEEIQRGKEVEKNKHDVKGIDREKLNEALEKILI